MTTRSECELHRSKGLQSETAETGCAHEPKQVVRTLSKVLQTHAMCIPGCVLVQLVAGMLLVLVVREGREKAVSSCGNDRF